MWPLAYCLFPRAELPQGSDLCDQVHQYKNVICSMSFSTSVSGKTIVRSSKILNSKDEFRIKKNRLVTAVKPKRYVYQDPDSSMAHILKCCDTVHIVCCSLDIFSM